MLQWNSNNHSFQTSDQSLVSNWNIVHIIFLRTLTFIPILISPETLSQLENCPIVVPIIAVSQLLQPNILNVHTLICFSRIYRFYRIDFHIKRRCFRSQHSIPEISLPFADKLQLSSSRDWVKSLRWMFYWIFERSFSLRWLLWFVKLPFINLL